MDNIHNSFARSFDTIDGGAGNDFIFNAGFNGIHKLIGGAGDDTIIGSLVGDSVSLIDGGAGVDYLVAQSSNDVLTGGADADYFDTYWANAAVKITDFKSSVDKLFYDWNENEDYHGSFAISANAFQSGKGLVSATTADARFVYNTTNGALFYDADGSAVDSSPVQIALIANKAALVFSDILIS